MPDNLSPGLLSITSLKLYRCRMTAVASIVAAEASPSSDNQQALSDNQQATLSDNVSVSLSANLACISSWCITGHSFSQLRNHPLRDAVSQQTRQTACLSVCQPAWCGSAHGTPLTAVHCYHHRHHHHHLLTSRRHCSHLCLEGTEREKF